jgi:tungstate transport system ATP-binding protein
MSKRLLTVERLIKSFAGRQLLDVSDLTLDAGALYVLSGDNGSGKTTLLRTLVGLEPADDLRFAFENETFSGHPYPAKLRLRMIYVHQHPYVFNTSIAENIAYGLKVRNLDARARQSAVREAIDWAGIGHLDHVPPRQLSGGEKQRLALARAKVLNPRVLLVDEPTANLDAAARSQVLDLLHKVISENNCVVVACHDREIIELPGVKRLHLEAGRLVAV